MQLRHAVCQYAAHAVSRSLSLHTHTHTHARMHTHTHTHTHLSVLNMLAYGWQQAVSAQPCRGSPGVWCPCSEQVAATRHGQHYQVRTSHPACHTRTAFHGDDDSRQAVLSSCIAIGPEQVAQAMALLHPGFLPFDTSVLS